jgi:transcriptional regulator PpsR
MLREATSAPAERPWRQVNHPGSAGVDSPVSYCAVRMAQDGRVLAIGRDLRAVASLQQRLVDAQQAMERDYLRLRQTEARYRLLFETVAQAVMMVDAATQVVVEANPAALRMFGEAAKRLVGRSFLDAFDAASRTDATTLLASLRTGGRADDVALRLPGSDDSVRVSASVYRQDNSLLVLIRLMPGQGTPTSDKWRDAESLMQVVDRVPDAFVVTDPQGRILTVNATFAELVQLPEGEQAQGEPLDRWLGRSSVDLNVLLGTLRQHGVVRLFPTTVRSQYGSPVKVEISAVAVPQGDPPCLGFTIRDIERRLAPDNRTPREIPRSASQLAELVGRIPLRDIVSETTDLIERMCIESALDLTHDNRASAAEMLGLSRQSLYVKLRRYGMGDLGPAPIEPE